MVGVVGRLAAQVDLERGIGDPDVAWRQRVGGAVGDLLRWVEDDVVVASHHHVDARRAAHHSLIDLEAQVRHHHDEVHVGPQQIDVRLRGLYGVERFDAEAVGLVEDRCQAREVGHADGRDLEPPEVEDLKGL